MQYLQVDNAGQRGFRRRCLDFDASVARRKSLGSMGGRKSLGSRLKDCSGSSIADDNSLSSGFAKVATSDATTRLLSSGNDFSNSKDSTTVERDSGTDSRGEFRSPSATGYNTSMRCMDNNLKGFKQVFGFLRS